MSAPEKFIPFQATQQAVPPNGQTGGADYTALSLDDSRYIRWRDLGLGKIASLISILTALSAGLAWVFGAVNSRPTTQEVKVMIREYAASREDVGKIQTKLEIEVVNLNRRFDRLENLIIKERFKK